MNSELNVKRNTVFLLCHLTVFIIKINIIITSTRRRKCLAPFCSYLRSVQMLPASTWTFTLSVIDKIDTCWILWSMNSTCHSRQYLGLMLLIRSIIITIIVVVRNTSREFSILNALWELFLLHSKSHYWCFQQRALAY